MIISRVHKHFWKTPPLNNIYMCGNYNTSTNLYAVHGNMERMVSNNNNYNNNNNNTYL